MLEANIDKNRANEIGSELFNKGLYEEFKEFLIENDIRHFVLTGDLNSIEQATTLFYPYFICNNFKKLLNII